MSYLKGSLVALVTPFTKQNRLDLQALKGLIHFHIKAKTSGIVCLGTTGESPTLSYEEMLAIINLCVSEADDKLPIIVGTGTNDTKKTVAFTKVAKNMGASASMVIVPYYNRPSERGCYLHFEKVSEAGLPVIFYYHPKRTGVTLSPSFIAKLYQDGLIQAIKEGSGNLSFQQEIKNLCSIPIYSGDDTTTLATLEMGGAGSISVIANLYPKIWRKMHDSFFAGRKKEAEEYFQYCLPMLQVLQEEVNPQGIKYALQVANKCKGNLRLPLLKPEPAVKDKIRALVLKEKALQPK